MQHSPLIEENCRAVEDFKAKKITEAEMWAIIRRNIHVETNPLDHEDHIARRGESVYDINRKGKAQPNGKITEIEEYGSCGSVVVSFFDEPEWSEVLIHMLDMNWDSTDKRWYVTQRKSTFFRDKLAAYRKLKGKTNE